MNNSVCGWILGAILALALPAWAHTDEYFEAVEAPHGGQLRMIGPYHLELVVKDRDITVYVTDHADNKITTDGGIGKATVETGQARSQIGLYPVGDNVLKGSGAFALEADTVVIVFIRLPDQAAHSARFMPLKPKSTMVEKLKDGTAPTEEPDTHHHHHHPPKH